MAIQTLFETAVHAQLLVVVTLTEPVVAVAAPSA